MFTGGGEYLGRNTGTYPLGPGKPPGTRYTPWDQVHPPEPGTPLGPGTPPGTEYTPLGSGTLPLDQVHPPGPDTPPPPPPGTRYTRRDQVHPPGPGTPAGTRYTPQAVHAGRYGQQAGGTHPTGMHSCSQCKHVVRDGWHCHLFNCSHMTREKNT